MIYGLFTCEKFIGKIAAAQRMPQLAILRQIQIVSQLQHGNAQTKDVGSLRELAGQQFGCDIPRISLHGLMYVRLRKKKSSFR